ncbi:hypothetical protein FRC09_018342, partial [Ceratobasidium sp. 395]
MPYRKHQILLSDGDIRAQLRVGGAPEGHRMQEIFVRGHFPFLRLIIGSPAGPPVCRFCSCLRELSRIFLLFVPSARPHRAE